MKRWRMTTPDREAELATLVLSRLTECDRKKRALIHTYPYLSVSKKIARAIVEAEKGQPRLLTPDRFRIERIARLVLHIHEAFDRENHWSDGYNHDTTALFIAKAIDKSEVR